MLVLYVVGTLIAALIAVAASFLFPTELSLNAGQVDGNPPGDIFSVLRDLLLNSVANPVSALMEANFIAILAWAIGLGLALRQASDTTRQALSDLSTAVTRIVTLVIRLAPLGIFGLVAGTLAESGVASLLNYAQLLGVIVGCMLFVALVSNPLLVYFTTRQNPYPLVFTCLRGSAITAFFHPQLGSQYPGQPGAVPPPKARPGHLLHIHSAGRDDQYVRRGHYDYRDHLGDYAYPGY
ncbi:hypothetical protein HORIV_50410 [Vreelandella olivaria]|uniref:Amino acid transporter n=1 Tax=Vreelandella olivaria TaxID=390919 RepID=A0ABM7GPH0_9GAMM|nr:hypothetical protein HORIV_50410 [Halomonas olivaria]